MRGLPDALPSIYGSFAAIALALVALAHDFLDDWPHIGCKSLRIRLGSRSPKLLTRQIGEIAATLEHDLENRSNLEFGEIRRFLAIGRATR
jgi:hypothetical protein